MNDRVARLREESFAAPVTLDHERARLVTAFTRDHDGEHSVPMMRALALRHLVEHKTIWIGAGELIVGERGPRPKCVSTYPELTCHSLEDLEILDRRPQNPYRVSDECRRIYRDEVIPFWQGRTMRDRILAALDEKWHQAYAAGLFTEFMEQRAPGPHHPRRQVLREGPRGLPAGHRREPGACSRRATHVTISSPRCASPATP